jgi:DNA-binding winged helix-turn-helix (wHTH) protein
MMEDTHIDFGAFRLLLPQRLLFKDTERVHLGSRALEVLVVLLERPGTLIPKRYLMQRIWPDMPVAEGTLRVHVASLRKALGEGHAGSRYIENITGHGYRLVAPVTRTQVAPRADDLRAVLEWYDRGG